MTTASLVWRIYWYILVVTPGLQLLASLSTGPAPSVDHSLGQSFAVAPFIFAAIVLAIVVLVATIRSRSMGAAERRVSLLIAFAALPMFVLVAYGSDVIIRSSREAWAAKIVIYGLLIAIWTMAMLALRRKAKSLRVEDPPLN